MRSIETLIAVAMIAGIAAHAASPARAADAPLAIGYVTKSATNQGWILINKGAEDAARDAGVRLIVAGPSTQGALAGQIYAIERVVAEGARAVAVAPVDSNGILPVVARITAAGIPVVAVDTAINGPDAKSYVATDNYAAAAAQADWVAGRIGDADEIVLVNGNLSQSTGRERRQGFLDRLKQLKPKVTVIEVQTSWDADEARQGVEAALRAHPKVTAVVNAWDDGTIATVGALRALGYQKGKVAVVGFDGAPNVLALIKTGWVQADVAQMLHREGYEGVKAAIAAARGEPIPARIDTGHEVVTAGTVDRFVEANGLAPFLR